MDGKENTVRLLFGPAGAIDGSHAVLTSTAISNTLRGVFRTAQKNAAPSLCLKDEMRAPRFRRARPDAASLGTAVRELPLVLVELLGQMVARPMAVTRASS